MSPPEAPWFSRLSLGAYSVREAARIAGVSPSTVCRWFNGYRTVDGGRRAPVFTSREKGRPLSYLQLVEVAFVATCRRDPLRMPLREIERARAYLSEMFDEPYPFASLRLKAHGPHLLKELEERAGVPTRLVVADASGQFVFHEIIRERLLEFEYVHGVAARWHPRGPAVPIVIDPRLAYGHPHLEAVGVQTRTLRSRYLVGETIEQISDDFGISPELIDLALRFERVGALAA